MLCNHTATHAHPAPLRVSHTGETLRTFHGHERAVTSAVFDRTGRWVLTASGDRTARLWDAKSGRCLRTFVTVPDGWLSLDENDRYRAGGNGLRYLTYADPAEHALIPTLWQAEDLPEMAQPEARPDAQA